MSEPEGNERERAPGEPARGERIRRLVEQIIARRARGEDVSDGEVLAANSELMPELGRELALAGEIRRQYLAAQKAGAREQAVEALTASQLDEPLADGAGGGDVDEHVRIEGYRVRRELRRGGQAAVYEAVQESTGRRVAIKVMAGGPYLSQRARARLEREVAVLAALDHPHVVRIVDRGRTRDGSFFLVMDYVEGMDLDEHLEARRVAGDSMRQVLRLFVQIARALDEAHRRGIVHRDLKPSNIRVDQRGEPRVLDFGLATLTAWEDPNSPGRQVTVSGNLIGSMPWASPEQASGHGRLSPASDVYSLGVVLYQALTGRPPYPIDGSLPELTRNILRATPADPTRAAEAPFGPIPAPLAKVMLKALAKDPAERQVDGRHLAAELEDCLADRPPAPRPASARGRQVWLAARVMLPVTLLSLLSPIDFAYHQRGLERPVEVADLPHLTNAIGMELVRVPSGMLTMGSPNEEDGHADNEQMHTVTLTHAVWMGVTEVKRREYLKVMERLPAGVPEWDLDFPVDHVTRAEAEEFCRRLSAVDGRPYRLPTEAEWEHACRANGGVAVGGTNVLDEMGWYGGNSGHQLHRVGTKQPNQWGLYDMEGSVAEWCADLYVPHLGYEPVRDPFFTPVKGSLGVIRGGSAFDLAGQCRVASRESCWSESAKAGVGFRVAITNPPTSRPAGGGAR